MDAYEQMRAGVLGAAEGGSLHGLAILMREGMSAWMCAMASLPTDAASPSSATVEGPAAALALVPTGAQREVIDVLATMALGSELEVRA